MLPDIAVLMPVFNPGPDLKDSLDSLRAQTIPFKLYLVDDGSSAPADYNVRTKGIDAVILRLPRNLGITGAMNAGLTEIMKSPFKYIARLDAGDMCKPNRFAEQKKYLDAHADIAILGSAVEFIFRDADGAILDTHTVVYPATPEACAAKLYFNITVIHPAMLIRRSVFENLKFYSEAYPAAEDFDLQWRAVKAGFKISNLPETLLTKEEFPGSISQKRRTRQIHSRLRIQWHNRNILSGKSWAGLAKSSLQLATPASLSASIKKIIHR
jgi:GT2 family glycosyltransferase